MRTWYRVLQAMVIALSVTVGAAAVPPRINYQGKLTDTGGMPLSGSHTLYFGLYQGGLATVANDGVKVFEESAIVTADSGVVNHAIGTGTNSFGGPMNPGMFATMVPVYLQVAVDAPGNVVLPRTEIESVPYAFTAANGGAMAAGEWASRAELPGPRKELACASLGGLVYAIGGRAQNNGTLGTVEAWNPATNTWSSTSSLTVPRYQLAAVSINGVMYAIGGLNGSGSPVNNVEVFNTGTSTWGAGTAMPLPAGPAAAAVLDGKIYVLGPTTTQIYDPGLGFWTVGASMPQTPNAGFTAAAASGRIYVFAPDTGTLEYNPQGNSWMNKGGYLRVGELPCAASVNGRIYVFFRPGSAAGNDDATMAKYDPVRNAYLGPVSMISSRSGSGCTVLGGRIYVAGGYRTFVTLQASDYFEEFTPPVD